MKTYQFKNSEYSKCKFFKFFKQKINFYLSFDVNSVAYSVCSFHSIKLDILVSVNLKYLPEMDLNCWFSCLHFYNKSEKIKAFINYQDKLYNEMVI